MFNFFSKDRVSNAEITNDVFVTYSNKDFEWVDRELIPLLEEHHVKYIIHSRDFELGKPIVENMADSIYKSRKVVVVLSRNYISSSFCMEELGMARQRSIDNGDTSVIAISIEKFKKNEIPKALRGFTFLDYADEEERKIWRTRLLKQLRKTFDTKL